MATIRTEKINILAAYLLANASAVSGKTAAEILEDVPAISKASLYRLLKHPAFKISNVPFSPARYYCDASEMITPIIEERAKASVGGMQIRPELIDNKDLDMDMFWQGIVRNFKDNSLYKELVPLALAANNARKFTQNTEELDPELWEAAKNSVDLLQAVCAKLYQRCEQLKSDPRYDSPEYWSILTGGK